jgi:hypothetical protein
MNAAVSQDAYVVLLDTAGHVLARSAGFTPQARRDLAISAALALVRTGHPYGLGNILPYGATGVINFAMRFPTRYGTRILLTGLSPSALSPFLDGELRRIPGVTGARNYVLDANRRVIASTDAMFPTGYVFTHQPYVAALSRASGDYRGYYYDQVRLADSTWRLVLAAPDGPLFVSVSGLRKTIPWVIFVAFALVAAAALALGGRILRSAEGRLTATETSAQASLRASSRNLLTDTCGRP